MILRPTAVICLVTALMLTLTALPVSAAGDRLALVIGNSGYQSLRPLANPVNDVAAVAEKLQDLGFRLIGERGEPAAGPLTDLDEDAFTAAYLDFAEAARGAEIALVYYAGHGMQIGGQSYLLPVDVRKRRLRLIRRNAIALDEILRELDGKAELTVAVFDACREIPEFEEVISQLSRSSGQSAAAYRGLGRTQSTGRSRIIAYSGAAGQLVKDGKGRHSPYTEVLLEHLEQPRVRGVEVDDLFQDVAWQFGQRHGGQNPEVLVQGVQRGRFYFLPPASPAPPPGTGPAPIAPPTAPPTSPPAAPNPVPVPGPPIPAGTVDSEAALALNRDERRQIQIWLNALGYDAGTPDGLFGRNTRQAISAFQTASGAQGSGYLNAVWRDGLHDAAEKLLTARALQAIDANMVPIKGGCFAMGHRVRKATGRVKQGDARFSYSSNIPVQEVCVGDFAIGRYEVTFDEYDRFALATGRGLPNDARGWGRGRRPVVVVTWQDAAAFARWLQQQTGRAYRLPTAAEWEYAARAGTRTRFWTGNCIDGTQANFDDTRDYTGCSGKTGLERAKTLPVGSFPANPWGLSDMHGNVAEWTCSVQGRLSDLHAEQQCAGEDAHWVIVKGGSWSSQMAQLRSGTNWTWPASESNLGTGFRLVRDP